MSDDVVRRFAEYDEQDLIRSFQRIFCNYYAINHEFFHSNVSREHRLIDIPRDQWSPELSHDFQNIQESLISALCSL